MSPIGRVSVPHLAEEFVLVCKLATYWGGSPRERWLRCQAGHKAADRGTEDTGTDNGHVDAAGRGVWAGLRQQQGHVHSTTGRAAVGTLRSSVWRSVMAQRGGVGWGGEGGRAYTRT